MTVWQVAAGAEGRNYEWAFLRYGLAFAGGEDNERVLAEYVQSGDVVILKRGTSQIRAVGRVVERNGIVSGKSDKAWLRDFDGWGLPAYCHVEWHTPPDGQLVATKGLTRTTAQGVGKKSVKDQALQLLDEWPARTDYDPEPDETEEVSDEQILTALIREGLSVAQAEDLTTAVRRIRLLARYYQRETDWMISEHETRAFLILPLLTALGWSEQQVRIEYTTKVGRLDAVCFTKPLHEATDDDCALILESKSFRHGLDVAHAQAKRYAKALPGARSVVVSNGYCYKVYLRADDNTFSEWPDAYLNLLRPRDRYPLDPSKGGAVETLTHLLPRRYR
jgi:hypothetical protein